jgi:polyribonucleotide nucleotidyltransferase
MENEIRANIGGKEITISTGKIAKQAEGSVITRMGDTVILSTVSSSVNVKPDMGFFPLTVEYRERAYSAGQIPGGFFKREGKPREKETLAARLIDRSIRPLFPWNLLNEVQVMDFVLSYDLQNDADILGINGTSAALALTNIPFGGPVGAVRVGKVEGSLIINPTISDLKISVMDLVVVFSKSGVIMLESGMKGVSEAEVFEAIKFAETPAKELIKMQEELASKVEKQKKTYTFLSFDPILESKTKAFAEEKINALSTASDKASRQEQVEAVKKEVVEKLLPEFPEKENHIKMVIDNVLSEKIRKDILENNIRPDGRKLDEIRKISCEVHFLPRTHGSAIFTRGQTQSLAVTTLGTKEDAQIMDELEGESKKRYMLHYNFPPFATGEVKPARGPGRREIGHGALAERALAPVIPGAEKFPYTIQIVSDILESNGSSSMASVCGATLSLMDAGVPISAPVAGISIGLVTDSGKFVTLTDIAGVEDHFGDMDFKVAGTAEGITAIQMDLKVEGISFEVIEQALKQARSARMIILEEIKKTIENPRTELSTYAPRIVTLRINPDKIKDVIGPSGKNIKKIVEDTGAKIDIENDGTINISSVDEAALNKAIDRIKEVTQEAEIGALYNGKVRKIMEFGAFVEIFPGQDGLVHISELSESRVKRVEDVLKEGDEVLVKVIGVDEKSGKIKLSRKAALKPQGSEGPK